jgi:hypothetical protein
MTDAEPQKLSLLAKLVVSFILVLIVAAVVWHGVSIETVNRVWHQLIDRADAPMRFRFILQPLMAAIAAILDGLKDARAGRSPYFWTMLRNPRERIERLNEGLNATARIILLGLVMDAIYQIIVLKRFYPAEAVIVALLFAFVPYVIIRGPVLRIERWWLGAPLQTGSREAADMNRRQEGIEHDRFTHRRKRGQVRSKGNGRQSFRLDPHSPQPRAHDDVVVAHGSGADRFRLRDRPVYQPLARNPRSPLRLSSNRAGIFGARADFVRRACACHIALAVLLDGSLSVGRIVRADRRTDKGGNAIAGHCGRHPPHRHWPLRLLCRAVPPHLGTDAK